MSGVGDSLRSWWRRLTADRREVEGGGEPVTIGPGDDEREMSTNAQVGGAVGEPYSDEE